MKSIIIIGAGVGGLAAGIYGQRNGFTTDIFEAHNLPGGQCTSWTRKGYVFDACIHHFSGSSPQLKFNAFWREVGA
ncbi:MAG: FAD/NAD(P)-binding protein, partial [Anaerolineales bacterium]